MDLEILKTIDWELLLFVDGMGYSHSEVKQRVILVPHGMGKSRTEMNPELEPRAQFWGLRFGDFLKQEWRTLEDLNL